MDETQESKPNADVADRLDGIVIFLLRWAISWAHIIDGVVGVISLGFAKPQVGLKTARVFAKQRYNRRK